MTTWKQLIAEKKRKSIKIPKEPFGFARFELCTCHTCRDSGCQLQPHNWLLDKVA